MSFKQGIPLLDAFQGNQSQEDNDSYSSSEDSESSPFNNSDLNQSKSRHYICSWRKWFVLGMAFIGIIILVLAIGIPLLVLHQQKSSTQPEPTTTGTVLKSPNDNRQYSYLQLNNGLRVLLVSDNETQLSAAAMDVAVGSFSDPSSYAGLAHFCEHMLFYGSRKYPQENAYSNFLSRHGGYDNAYTSFENTNYFFRVSSDYLHEALDRFAQFFISPILVQDGVSREVNAVDAEHRKNLQSDGWRVWQLLKQVSNPYHPMHKFNTGDLSTLDKPGLLTALRNFYDTHYSANQMQLVIYGKEDIATLTNWANTIFSSIINKNINRPRFGNTSFPSSYNGKIVYYIPVANSDTISLYWQVPPLRQKYRERVSGILSELLGHEGHGSILHYLKTQQWATSLSAGTDVSTDTYSLITIGITLTQSGLTHSSQVIATVIQYIKLLQASTDNQWRVQWNDYVDVAFVNFNFSAKTNPDSYTSNLASQMRIKTDSEDFLGSPLRFLYNHTLLSQVVSSLSPSSLVAFVGSKNLTKPQELSIDLPLPTTLSLIEPIYGTQYAEVPISNDLASNWSNTRIPGLGLPSPNQFIPRDFKILPKSSATKNPLKLYGSPNGTSIWWQQDTQILHPKLNIRCNLYARDDLSDDMMYNPKWAALSLLYTSIVSTIINPELYPANLVGSTASIASTSKGLSISVSGYSDVSVVSRIINIVVSAMKNQSAITDTAIYSLSLESLKETLSNYNYTALPYRYTYEYIQSNVMERPSWKYWQLLQILQNSSLTSDELYKHTLTLLNSSSLLCLVHGNVNQTQALSYGTSLQGIINNPPFTSPKGNFTSIRLRLSPGNYSVVVPALNPQDINSVVSVMFQIGSICDINTTCANCNCSADSLKTNVLASLLTLQIKQSCFDVLRTKQQLGYVAHCSLTTNQNIAAFQVIVQSGTQNASLVLDRIDQFLIDSQNNLTTFLASPDNLNSLKKVYRDILARKDLTLSESTTRLWYQVGTSGQEQFNYRSQLNTTLEQITSGDILQFYSRQILNCLTYKKLVVAVYGKDKQETLDAPFTNELDYTQINPRAISYP